MSDRIVAFSKMQIWFHKHIIHFMMLFIATGLPLLAPSAFAWLAWLYGIPLSAMTGVQSSAETLALGMQAARVLHWACALFFIITAIPFAAVLLRERDTWEIWPDAVGVQPIREGVEQLRQRYLLYRDAETGKYNIGQKGLAWLMIVGVSTMIVSGLLLMLRSSLPDGLVGFARFLHALFFILIAVSLIFHVYLATHPINRAGLKAIFGDGEMDAEEVKHHHPLWWKKLNGK